MRSAIYNQFPHDQHTKELYDVHRKIFEQLDNFSICVEIGSWKGATIALWNDIELELNKTFHFYAIDIWDTSYYQQCKKDNPNCLNQDGDIIYKDILRNFRIHKANGMILREDGAKAAQYFDDNIVSYVFIDGEHTTEQVCKEIEAWKPKLTEKGILAGHDYQLTEVRQALEKIFPNGVETIGNTWIEKK